MTACGLVLRVVVGDRELEVAVEQIAAPLRARRILGDHALADRERGAVPRQRVAEVLFRDLHVAELVVDQRLGAHQVVRFDGSRCARSDQIASHAVNSASAPSLSFSASRAIPTFSPSVARVPVTSVFDGSMATGSDRPAPRPALSPRRARPADPSARSTPGRSRRGRAPASDSHEARILGDSRASWRSMIASPVRYSASAPGRSCSESLRSRPTRECALTRSLSASGELSSDARWIASARTPRNSTSAGASSPCFSRIAQRDPVAHVDQRVQRLARAGPRGCAAARRASTSRETARARPEDRPAPRGCRRSAGRCRSP